jgi:hypothetical protein
MMVVELVIPHHTVRITIYRQPRYTATNCGEETITLCRGFGYMYSFLRVFSVAYTVGQLGWAVGLVHNSLEIVWKEADMAQFDYHPEIFRAVFRTWFRISVSGPKYETRNSHHERGLPTRARGSFVDSKKQEHRLSSLVLLFRFGRPE